MPVFFLSGAMLFTACSEDGDGAEYGFALSATECSISAEGGSQELSYSLKGISERPGVKALCEADWIYDLDCSEYGAVKFDVEPTDNREPREATVRLIVPGYALETQFVVRQEAGEIADFSVSVSDLRENRAYYSVIPYDKEATYIALLDNEEGLPETATDEEIYAYIREYMEKYAERVSQTLEDVIPLFLKTGNLRDEIYYSLKPDTRYSIFVYGMTEDGTPTTPVTRTFFSTLPLEMSGTRFAFDCKVDGTRVTVDVTPNRDDRYYMCDYGLKATSSGEDFSQWAQRVLDEMIQKWETNTMYTTERAVAEICKDKGPVTKSFNLEPETEYAILAVSVNAHGVVDSEASVAYFTTEAKKYYNEFDVKITDIRSFMVQGTVTAATDDWYAMGVGRAADYAGLSDEEILARLTDPEHIGSLSRKHKKGDSAFAFFNLLSETDYELYVFGYDFEENKITTDLVRMPFTTLSEE